MSLTLTTFCGLLPVVVFSQSKLFTWILNIPTTKTKTPLIFLSPRAIGNRSILQLSPHAN